MRLNLGSGDHPAPPPWINVDSCPDVAPHIVADARDLPFRDATVGMVYCGHLLEHLTLDEGVPDALREIQRVLRPGGELLVVGPDYDRALSLGDDVLLGLIRTGGRRWPGDAHQWVSTETLAVEAVRRVFPDAGACDPASLVGWPVVAVVDWQFGVCASKE